MTATGIKNISTTLASVKNKSNIRKNILESPNNNNSQKPKPEGYNRYNKIELNETGIFGFSGFTSLCSTVCSCHVTCACQTGQMVECSFKN